MRSIGILGLGKMGESILKGLQSSSLTPTLQATRGDAQKAQETQKRLGVPVHTNNKKCAQESRVIVLAVKPYRIREICEEIKGTLKSDQTVISVAAALTCDQLAEWLGGHTQVIRAMPNTPTQVKAGVTLLSAHSQASSEAKKEAESIFSEIGKALWIPEKQMDAATAISGCGPAYAYLAIEGLMAGGARLGLDASLSKELAAATLLGAARMVLELSTDPTELRKAVATPGGMTEQGVLALERHGARKAFEEAVLAAAAKAQELRK
jgi:pyrroline-5-carboxylate reductase